MRLVLKTATIFFAHIQILVKINFYLSWHIRCHRNDWPQRRVDSKKHYPKCYAAPDSYMAELLKQTKKKKTEQSTQMYYDTKKIFAT